MYSCEESIWVRVKQYVYMRGVIMCTCETVCIHMRGYNVGKCEIVCNDARSHYMHV